MNFKIGKFTFTCNYCYCNITFSPYFLQKVLILHFFFAVNIPKINTGIESQKTYHLMYTPWFFTKQAYFFPWAVEPFPWNV
jgi:hypothetical protein